MIRYFRALCLGLGLAVIPAVARATTCSQAHTFVTGETLTNTILNANPANFVTCFQSIDSNNIGSGGIWASQIKPGNTAQATFGGQFGYVVAPGIASQVPLTLQGASGQSADLLDILLFGGSNAFKIGSAGAATFGSSATVPGGLILTTGGAGLSGSQAGLVNDASATNGIVLNVPSGSTNGFRFQVNGSTVAQITAGGSALFNGSLGAGSGFIGAAGDIGAARSATFGIYYFGGTTGSATGSGYLQLSSATYFFGNAGSSANVASIAQSTGQYTQISDRRLKSDVQPVLHGLDAVMRLRPVHFRWKANNKSDVGFIAQDVQKVVPEVVGVVDPKRGYLGVNYSGITPVLTAAIQQQQAEIKKDRDVITALAIGFLAIVLLLVSERVIRARVK